jgi:hypothetical protein
MKAMLRRVTAKKRKLRFEVQLTLQELTNVATRDASVWVKVKCPGCAAVESRRTKLADQAVVWGETFPLVCNMTVDDASNVVDSLVVRLSVRAAAAATGGGAAAAAAAGGGGGGGGGAFERLGVVNIDLAELVGVRETERGFLLEESSFNAVLKVGLTVHQVAGDAMFRARSADDAAS